MTGRECLFRNVQSDPRGSRRSLARPGSGSQVCASTRLGLETDPSRSAIIGGGLIKLMELLSAHVWRARWRAAFEAAWTLARTPSKLMVPGSNTG